MDILTWLIDWYRENCDGDWEHSYGVRIETIDNPGWAIKIDLSDTNLAGKVLERTLVEKSDTDWYSISSDGISFDGHGDPSKLEDLIRYFKDFAEQ